MSTTSAENNNENDNNTTVAPEAREEANIGVAPQGEVAAPKEGKGRKGGKSGSGGGKKGKRGGTKKKGSSSGSNSSKTSKAKTAKPSKSIRTVRDKIKCSFCANLMSQSKNINYVEIPGKKVARSGKTGEPMYKSLKGDSDAVLGVLCDDCLKLKESGVASVKLKTAVIERRDGTVMNIPLRDVPNA